LNSGEKIGSGIAAEMNRGLAVNADSTRWPS